MPVQSHTQSYRYVVGVISAFIGLGTLSPALGQAPGFQGLGDLPGGGFFSQALDVSADGSVVVGQGSSASGLEAFRWTQLGGMVALGDLPGWVFSSIALGVSADGSVVVGDGVSASGREAFRWTQGGGMVGLGDLPGGTFRSQARGVSADGSVVVGQGNSASGFEVFRWTQGGGMVGLGDLPGGIFESRAFDVSADGSVVVGFGNSSSGRQAFRWTQGGGTVGLGNLPGGSFNSKAIGVSADGSVVVGRGISGSFNEAFRWTQGGGMVGLGFLPGGGFFSEGFAVSADGSVVVGTDGTLGAEAFIWDQTYGMRSLRDVLVNDFGLDLAGWILHDATGVSDDGRVIVGLGVNPNGDREAWMATLPLLCTEDAECDDADECMLNLCVDGSCQSSPRIAGDVDKNGTVDIFDLLCVLSAFAGDDNCSTCPTVASGMSDVGLFRVGLGVNPSGDPEPWVVALSCTADAQCNDGEECTLNLCVGGVCQTNPRIAGDVNKDGTVNIFDLLCVLAAFAGDDNCSTCP